MGYYQKLQKHRVRSWNKEKKLLKKPHKPI